MLVRIRVWVGLDISLLVIVLWFCLGELFAGAGVEQVYFLLLETGGFVIVLVFVIDCLVGLLGWGCVRERVFCVL